MHKVILFAGPLHNRDRFWYHRWGLNKIFCNATTLDLRDHTVESIEHKIGQRIHPMLDAMRDRLRTTE